MEGKINGTYHENKRIILREREEKRKEKVGSETNRGGYKRGNDGGLQEQIIGRTQCNDKVKTRVTFCKHALEEEYQVYRHFDANNEDISYVA